MALENEEITVGMGRFEVRISGYILSCVGIGSCVAVIIFDNERKIFGMAHVMLPYISDIQTNNPNKFADVCIPNMIKNIIRIGGKRENLKAKITGGAHMFPSLKKDAITINVRNIEAVRTILEKEGIPIIAKDLGGNYGRTIKVDTATGTVNIIVRATNHTREL